MNKKLSKSHMKIFVGRKVKIFIIILVTFLISPYPLRLKLFQIYLKYSPYVKHSKKSLYDAVDRPWYSYGIINSVIQAKSLGYTSMAVLEFGVASGEGIKVLQKIQKEILDEFNFEIHIYGFDSSEGLPKSNDTRDQVYFWKQSMFSNKSSDYTHIEQDKTTIILGNVEDTASTFIKKYKPPIIGFIAFDLDYYTSTKASFHIFQKSNIDKFLPRVECFMDDTASYNHLSANIRTGVLAAISDFNEISKEIQILQKLNIGRSRKIISGWFDGYYTVHFFEHQLYNEFIEYQP